MLRASGETTGRSSERGIPATFTEVYTRGDKSETEAVPRLGAPVPGEGHAVLLSPAETAKRDNMKNGVKRLQKMSRTTERESRKKRALTFEKKIKSGGVPGGLA